VTRGDVNGRLLVAGAADALERVQIVARRIGIDAMALAERGPLIGELIKRCADCRTKLACAFWLAENGNEGAFREFCPNAGAFVELGRCGPLELGNCERDF
jgi:Family of unknown function (DUF6455)